MVAYSANKQGAHCAFGAAGSTSMSICLILDTVIVAVSIFIVDFLLRFLCK